MYLFLSVDTLDFRLKLTGRENQALIKRFREECRKNRRRASEEVAHVLERWYGIKPVNGDGKK